MADVCARAPGSFPVALQDKTFSIIVTVVTPAWVILCLSIFLRRRHQSTFLLKRPFWQIATCAFGVMIAWAVTPVYDLVGPDVYPCWLFGLLFHLVIPFLCAPLALKASIFFTSLMSIKEEMNKSFRTSVSDETDFIGIRTAASWKTFSAHLRTVCRIARPGDKALNLQFSKSAGFIILWVGFISLPSLLTFAARMGTEPRWNQGCNGCEASGVDMGVSLAMFCIGSFLGIWTHARKVNPKDPLRVIRECFFCWSQGFFCIIGASLYLADPGGVHAQGHFNWRIIILFAGMSLLYVQTIHQVIIYQMEKARLLTQVSANRHEAFKNMMLDKEMRHAFRQHLNSELSPEIHLFMESVGKFRIQATTAEGQKRARKIFENFVDYGSEWEINVSASIRDEIIQQFKGDEQIPVQVFDRAYADIQEHLMNDSFLRFLSKYQETGRLKDILTTQRPISRAVEDSPRYSSGGTPRSLAGFSEKLVASSKDSDV